MMKIACIPVLFVLACLFAGLYGALHNQISYTVSPEYFTRYKFVQFDVAPALPARVGAALVGWKAAWWMGLVIGGVLIPLGLLIPGAANYFKSMLMAFGVVTCTTLLVGLMALAWSFLSLGSQAVGEVSRYGNAIQDDLAFVRAGTMHNFSYLGGLLGIITASLSILLRRHQLSRKRDEPATDSP